MTELIGSAIMIGVGALACGAGLSRMLLRYRQADESGGGNLEAGAARADAIALDRYTILARLTSEDDAQFLQGLPGAGPGLAGRLRRERRSILRLYLRELAADFHCLHAEARRLVAEAPEEHVDLVGVLMRQQIAFWRNLAVLEARLTLAPLGLAQVDIRPLLETVEALRAAVAPAAA